MKVTKLVQSTILVEHGDTAVLFDPGLYNVQQGVSANRFSSLDALVITHRHTDHFDPDFTRELVSRFSPRVITNPEIAIALGKEGVGAEIGRPRDEFEIGSLRLTLTYADHQVRGEVIPNFGFVISDGDKRLYHTSDTGMIESARLGTPAAAEPDVMFVPISNRGVVMGVDDALHMVADFKPAIAVPMHYDSPKDAPRVNSTQFVTRHQELRGVLDGLEKVQVEVLDLDDVLEL